MALPPNQFKLLLEGSSEEIYQQLKTAGCLSLEGFADKAQLIMLIETTVSEHTAWMEAQPGWVGPNGVDQLETVLLASTLINQKARELAKQDGP